MRMAIVVAVLAVYLAAPRVMTGEAPVLASTDTLSPGTLSPGTLSPGTGEQWFALGRSLYDASRYRESVAAFERGLQLRAVGASNGAWNIARAYARLENRKQTLRWLTHARELGFRDERATRQDPAFEKYRSDPAFREVVSPSSCSVCRLRTERGIILM